eukprot:59123_1
MRIAIQTTKLRRHYNATYFAINSTKLVGLLPARSHAMVVFCVPDNLEYLNQIDACFEWNYASSIHHILKCRIRTHSLKYVKASPDPADETYSHWYPGLRKVDPYLYPPCNIGNSFSEIKKRLRDARPTVEALSEMKEFISVGCSFNSNLTDFG